MEGNPQRLRYLWTIFIVSFRLGCTSFGGPVAHLGYFHEEYVRRRKWLDEKSYADLIALSQFLPGPGSSQVGMGIGMMRGGLLGGMVSFLGFTLPSVIILVLFALFIQQAGVDTQTWIQGLKIVAVAVVAHALLGMGKKLAPDRDRATLAVAAFIVITLIQTTWSQVAVILLAGLIGYFLFTRTEENEEGAMTRLPISRKTGALSLTLFTLLLVALPLLNYVTTSLFVQLIDLFYRAGSLVFGGGHVVLPLLEREVVPTGLVGEEAFLAGYGVAQAVPGPLFTFASYLGAVIGGWPMAILATVAIFLPAFLLIIGVLPFWDELRTKKWAKGALKGINASVVGILAAAFYDPIWTSTIHHTYDIAGAAFLFAMLVYWKLPAWSVVFVGICFGSLYTLFL
ncbi:chromate efflux transporter [Texcoconibacillus texcoconensis]|uniref:Chromate transporter n=1 Tax=Texcoconibacillus texcoconensis TaxID=1095777 RepID=A0A840QPK7_9BACI|nr:chromate efflux transporter [Texcoconibacillus texcoconensis]MBB5173305.1 chromate transporter [Texcoconibacillus texcoconensis]